jgi:hypothetical protein
MKNEEVPTPEQQEQPPGGHAAERLREMLERRFPGGNPPAEETPEETATKEKPADEGRPEEADQDSQDKSP